MSNTQLCVGNTQEQHATWHVHGRPRHSCLPLQAVRSRPDNVASSSTEGPPSMVHFSKSETFIVARLTILTISGPLMVSLIEWWTSVGNICVPNVLLGHHSELEATRPRAFFVFPVGSQPKAAHRSTANSPDPSRKLFSCQLPDANK